jgi:hypothetical protein
MNNVKTVNSSVRTILMLGLVGVVGYGGYFGYENYVKPSQQAKQAIADLETLKQDFEEQAIELKRTSVDLAESNLQNQRLETSIKLLKVDRRIANLEVLDKGKDEDGNPFMEVGFTEVDEYGDELGSTKNYTIQGSKLYIDGWVVAFEDKYIEKADELRGASLFVFKSIYGDGEAPRDAQRLDTDSNARPGVYDSDEKSDFENQIWSDFWSVCNDVDKQQDLGIRTSHGQASYIMGKKGKTYQVELRASGKMGIKAISGP